MTISVVLIGLGTVAATHVRVLEEIDDVDLIAAVDPSPKSDITFRSKRFPVYESIAAVPGHLDPGFVLVATPTSSHVAVCTEALARFPGARILLEKPAADNAKDLQHLFAFGERKSPLTVIYHLAFSTEVLWGAKIARARVDEIGEPERFEQLFCDAYESDVESAKSRLGTSWLDSGINALSILQRFVDPVERNSLRAVDASGLVYEAVVDCRTTNGAHAEALIVTSWHVGAASRTTRIRFTSGAHLVLDHVGVAGYLITEEGIIDQFGSDGTISRGRQRYHALYKSLFGDGMDIYDSTTSLRLNRLLLDSTPLQPPVKH